MPATHVVVLAVAAIAAAVVLGVTGSLASEAVAAIVSGALGLAVPTGRTQEDPP